jgi:hypothetical protein
MPESISNMTEKLLIFGSGAIKILDDGFCKKYLERDAGEAKASDYKKAARFAATAENDKLAAVQRADTDGKKGVSVAEYRAWLTRPEGDLSKKEISFSKLKPREKIEKEYYGEYIASAQDYAWLLAKLDERIAKGEGEVELIGIENDIIDNRPRLIFKEL